MKKMLLLVTNVLGLSICGLQSMPRDVIILINDEENQQRLDALQLTLFQALATKAAPILVSGALWRNFANARYDFDKQKDIQNTPENIAYHKIYRKIDDQLKAASVSRGPITPERSNMMIQLNTMVDYRNYAKQNPAFEGEINQAIGEVTNLIGGMLGTSQMNLFEKNFAAHAIPFEAAEWDIYTSYKNAFFLLIPHEYAQRTIKETEASSTFTAWPKFQHTPTDVDVSDFDETVARLGFKTNQLTKLSAVNDYDLPRPFEQVDYAMPLSGNLFNIMVTRWDIVPFKDEEGNDVQYYPFVWNVLLNGHGSYSVSPDNQQYLDLLLEKIKEIQSKVQEVVGHKPSFERMFGPEFKEALFNAIDQLKPYICGMPSHDFSMVLDFFNNNVQTGFLLYSSCFAGKYNLLYPYLDYFGYSKRLNYTIVAGTSEDLNTRAKAISFSLASGIAQVERENIKIISKQGLSVDLSDQRDVTFVPKSGTMDFGSFFSALRNEQKPPPLSTITRYVLGETIPKFVLRGNRPTIEEKQVAYYKPVVRLPYGETFYVNDIDDRLARISRVTLSAAQAERGAFEVDADKKVGVMLNTYYVPVDVVFKNGLPFSIASSIYRPTLPDGIMGYYFKKIDCVESISPIDDLAQKFLREAFDALKGNDLRKNPVPKVFICDEVISSARNYTFEHVFIFNRLMLPDVVRAFLKNTIKGVSAEDEIRYVTGYFYDINIFNDVDFQGYVMLRDKDNHERAVPHSLLIEDETVKNAIIKLYNDYKNILTQKAEKDGLTLLDLTKVKAAIEEKKSPERIKAIQEKIQQMQERAAGRAPMLEEHAAKRKQRELEEKTTKARIKAAQQKLQELKARTAQELKQIEARGQEQAEIVK